MNRLAHANDLDQFAHIGPEDARVQNLSPEMIELRYELGSRLPAFASRAPARLDPLEHRCRLYLRSLRWPAGIECPRCDETERLHWLDSRQRWQCYSCKYQFSVTAGTLFHSSHLPLWKWFLSIHLMTETPRGMSALRLREILGGSYKSYWFTAHRIRAAMGVTAPRVQAGSAQAGSARVGSARAGRDRYRAAYASERRWRAAHSANGDVFRDTIVALLRHEGITYRRLTGEAEAALAATR